MQKNVLLGNSASKTGKSNTVSPKNRESNFPFTYGSFTQRYSDKLRKTYTGAEREFETVLDDLNGGILQKKYHREWAFGGKWILDFYFWEERIGIEKNGGYHNSKNSSSKMLKKRKPANFTTSF